MRRATVSSSNVRCKDAKSDVTSEKEHRARANDDNVDTIIEKDQLIHEAPTLENDDTTNATAHMRKNLAGLAHWCDWYSVFHRAGAAAATSVLEDFGTVFQQVPTRPKSSTKTSYIGKEKVPATVLAKVKPILGHYFEGRMDTTFQLIPGRKSFMGNLTQGL